MKGRNAMPTTLLNDDGTASMATMLMTSHHAFRRDAACFARAIENAHELRAAEVEGEWKQFRNGLHHHHTIEDTSMFPDLRAKHPEIAAAIDRLGEQHHQIDPLLDRGDVLFTNLAIHRDEAREVIGKIIALLDEHLELEERTITVYLRDAKEFPLPPTDEAAAMYAQGFAWSTAGIAAPVLAKILAMLPPALVEKFPAAQVDFDERCRRVWGHTHDGATTTSVPAAAQM
jgi:hypothetical protein